MKISTGSTALLLVALTGVWCDENPGLALLLTKSQLVVSGTITSRPMGTIGADGVITYLFSFKVTDVLKGKPPDAGDLSVGMIRYERGSENRLPYLQKGAQCILFLKSAPPGDLPRWESADPWFGIQPYNAAMVQSLKRLAAEEAKKKC